MPLEYTVWDKTPVLTGVPGDKDFPVLTLAPAVTQALLAASAPPPYRGGVPKKYEDPLTRLFFNWDNKLLHPDQARRVGLWLVDWADSAAAGGDAGAADAARAAADWFARASAAGWFVDWSIW